MTIETDTQMQSLRFEWQWNWKVLLFTLVFLPLTLRLGFWQLERMAEKQAILEVHQQRAIAPPIMLALAGDGDRQYLNVSVSGYYDSKTTLLLDNHVRRGRPGYEVISVFRAEGLPAILVNRGWVEGSLDRAVLPVVPKVAGEQVLSGYLYRSPGQQLMLGDDLWRADKPLQIVQNAAPEIAAERLGEPVYDYTLRLDQLSAGALETGWQVVNVQPEKHRGYAVQWFVMSAVLLLLTVLANSNLAAVWRSRRAPCSKESK